MNIKPIVDLVSHSPAFRYWLLLIPVKTTGSWAFLGLVRVYLAKQANKVSIYLSNKSGYSVLKLASNRPDRVVYMMYYLMTVGDVIQ